MRRYLSTALVLSLVAGGGLLAGNRSRARAATQLSFTTHRTNISFITVADGVVPYPMGPLSAGDRIVLSDDLLQDGMTIGSDYGVCTLTFDATALCDVVATFTNQGQVHATYMLQWPSSADSAGPTAFDGIIDGGTLAFENAHGSFHADALPNGDYQFTATIADPAQ
jgi:hypothetical protein